MGSHTRGGGTVAFVCLAFEVKAGHQIPNGDKHTGSPSLTATTHEHRGTSTLHSIIPQGDRRTVHTNQATTDAQYIVAAWCFITGEELTQTDQVTTVLLPENVCVSA